MNTIARTHKNIALSSNKNTDASAEWLLVLLHRELRFYDAEEVVCDLLEVVDEIGAADKVTAKPAGRRRRKHADKIAETIVVELAKLGHGDAIEAWLDKAFLERQRVQIERASAAIERGLASADTFCRARLVDAVEQDVAVLVEKDDVAALRNVMEHSGYKANRTQLTSKEIGDALIALARGLPTEWLRNVAAAAAWAVSIAAGGSHESAEVAFAMVKGLVPRARATA